MTTVELGAGVPPRAAAFRSTLRFQDDGGFPLTLIDPLVYDSLVLGTTITVPAGFKTDLASIPRALYIALPPVGRYDAAAVIHDALYQWGGVRPPRAAFLAPRITRGHADAVLREAMEVCKVNRLQRWAIYRGVRLGGWHAWNGYRHG